MSRSKNRGGKNYWELPVMMSGVVIEVVLFSFNLDFSINYLLRKFMKINQSPQNATLILTLLGLGILHIIGAELAYFLLLSMVGISLAYQDSLRPLLLRQKFLMRLVVVSFLTTVFWVHFTGTAQALWLDDIESWMTGAFPDSADLAQLIFNTLRAFYVLFLIISGINVFLAGRRQEGLWEAAQLPLLSLIIVGVIDIVSGFIIA
jgi:hypothetical protein